MENRDFARWATMECDYIGESFYYRFYGVHLEWELICITPCSSRTAYWVEFERGREPWYSGLLFVVFMRLTSWYLCISMQEWRIRSTHDIRSFEDISEIHVSSQWEYSPDHYATKHRPQGVHTSALSVLTEFKEAEKMDLLSSISWDPCIAFVSTCLRHTPCPATRLKVIKYCYRFTPHALYSLTWDCPWEGLTRISRQHCMEGLIWEIPAHDYVCR